jgi:Rod binding domain-containing protein
MIDIDGVIRRLMQLMQDTHLAPCLSCSRKDGIAEMILRYYL